MLLISIELFMIGLLIVSALTGLTTEAIKKILAEHDKQYKSNTLAGIVALILSAVVGVFYVLATKSAFTSQVIICIVMLIFMSWLCAMVGYDKVIQTISQFKTTKE